MCTHTIIANINTQKELVARAKKNGLYVYIGRGSIWGNPYRMGVDGTRDEVCDMYETYLRNNKELMDKVHELKGKTLGCFCWPNRCHGNLLAALAGSYVVTNE